MIGAFMSDLRVKLARIIVAHGAEEVFGALSDVAWDRSQSGLPESGQWRRIFIALQDVRVALQQDPAQEIEASVEKDTLF